MRLARTDTLRAPNPASRTPLRGQGPGTAAPSHLVQFYNDDGFLCAAVADFLAEGIAARQPITVIATEAHRHSIVQRLIDKGIDVASLLSTRACMCFDARDMLATFMVGSLPDRQRFRASVGGVMEVSRKSNPQAVVRAYGEMVNLLWMDGNLEGAIQLEGLWNELAHTHPLTLLCAYAMGNFTEESHAVGFADICRHHTHVIPTEDYTQADDEGRLREISRLQQRAEALSVEVARREALEGKLLDALAREQTARAEAETAARAKGDFLAMMSHELRTPLNAIGGYVQLLELGVHGELTEGQRGALARVQRSQRHLLSLINQVLDLARTEQRHMEYVIEAVSVSSVVAEICSMVEPLLQPKRLTCDISGTLAAGPASPLLVRADGEKMQQILLNLLSNAIKFTPDGGQIAIDAIVTESPAVAHIRVRDTGVGIPPESLERIFAPFVQVSGNGEGSGLGLAISRSFARGMGGDLTVDSTVGEGSTFTLSLPLGGPGPATL